MHIHKQTVLFFTYLPICHFTQWGWGVWGLEPLPFFKIIQKTNQTNVNDIVVNKTKCIWILINMTMCTKRQLIAQKSENSCLFFIIHTHFRPWCLYYQADDLSDKGDTRETTALKYNLFLWILFSIITPVFNAWSFRNNYNMLIYYQCWKQLCCLMFYFFF